jgi:hypothetical protein
MNHNDPKPLLLYTLRTNAPYDVISRLTAWIALAGHVAILNEEPTDGVVIRPKRLVWGALRWWAVIAVLSIAPFVFRYWPGATALHGFGVGWMTAAGVLLARRGTS